MVKPQDVYSGVLERLSRMDKVLYSLIDRVQELDRRLALLANQPKPDDDSYSLRQDIDDIQTAMNCVKAKLHMQRRFAQDRYVCRGWFGRLLDLFN